VITSVQWSPSNISSTDNINRDITECDEIDRDNNNYDNINYDNIDHDNINRDGIINIIETSYDNI